MACRELGITSLLLANSSRSTHLDWGNDRRSPVNVRGTPKSSRSSGPRVSQSDHGSSPPANAETTTDAAFTARGQSLQRTASAPTSWANCFNRSSEREETQIGRFEIDFSAKMKLLAVGLELNYRSGRRSLPSKISSIASEASFPTDASPFPKPAAARAAFAALRED